jgi:pantoate--beta-alanine ligase
MSMKLLTTVREFADECDAVRARGGRVGLVPTMGALHAGHLALIEKARSLSDAVAVTIFVNPTQFGPNEDFARYPRDLERDAELCREAGASLVFSPPVEAMYPPNERTRVRVSGLTDFLCGPKRPGHFEGVATIVTKLFNVTGPSVAVFGRKDYQQLKVIERLVRDLLLRVEIVGHPTVRDSDGLALSSRNTYLSPAERARALAIPRALSLAAKSYASGERNAGRIQALVAAEVEEAADRVDYVSVADPDELSPYAPEAELGPRALVAIAAFVGSTRLIDNLVLGEDAAIL